MKAARARRRGTIYLLVLVTTGVVTAAGVTGVMLARAERTALEWTVRSQRAQRHAESALHAALESQMTAPGWRADRVPGADGRVQLWSSDTGRERARVSAIAADGGSIAGARRGPVRLRAEGVDQGATRIFEVELTPEPQAMSCLDYTIASGGILTKGTSFSCSGAISSASGGGITLSLGTIDLGLLEVQTPEVSLGVTASTGVRFPGTSICQDYAPFATRIAYSALPLGTLRRLALGPGRNPYGAANPLGIYMIDCGGQKIIIEDCRVLGTLIIVNARSDSELRGEVLIQPAHPELPALIVHGGLRMTPDNAQLSEAAVGASLNPVGAAFGGVSDNDTTDRYPSRIEGVVLVLGNLSTAGDVNIVGGLYVTGTITNTGSLIVTDDPAVRAAVPWGFETAVKYRRVDDTWAVVPAE